jgi:hypothetical protein
VRELIALGCGEVFSERASSVAKRSELDAALRYVRKGDTLVVTLGCAQIWMSHEASDILSGLPLRLPASQRPSRKVATSVASRPHARSGELRIGHR